jgi:hypothetical protein
MHLLAATGLSEYGPTEYSLLRWKEYGERALLQKLKNHSDFKEKKYQHLKIKLNDNESNKYQHTVNLV